MIAGHGAASHVRGFPGAAEAVTEKNHTLLWVLMRRYKEAHVRHFANVTAVIDQGWPRSGFSQSILLLLLCQILMPKMELGIFKDDAIERWYLLWRAGHIIGFYKETASTNMFICVLQCLFGVVRACIMEYLSKLVSHPRNALSQVDKKRPTAVF